MFQTTNQLWWGHFGHFGHFVDQHGVGAGARRCFAQNHGPHGDHMDKGDHGEAKPHR